jgi:mannonate dehydratase
MKLALILPPYPNERWTLARQLGVTHAVTQLPNPEPSLRPWDFMPLLHLRQRFEDAGIAVAVIESSPPMHNARLGRPERDREIDDFLHARQQHGRGGDPGSLLQLDGRVRLDAHVDHLANARRGISH